MTTHTPGPWRRVDYEIVGPRDEPLLQAKPASFLCGSIFEVEANLTLATAAPDLLAACQSALTDWHSHPRNFERKEPPYLAELRGAIAKAKGERLTDD